MKWGLDGRIALVTGASRGIGRAIAIRLAEEGCDVAVNYNTSKDAAQEVLMVIRGTGRRSVAVQADVASPEQVESMVTTVEGELGPVDILVNNAGIHISSIVADIGSDHEAHYTASKAGMHGLTKSLALELSPQGVTVNAVSPGWIRTDMTADVTEEEWDEALAEIPMGRIGEPEEIASVVAYLSSPESSYVTGQVLHVNGGACLY